MVTKKSKFANEDYLETQLIEDGGFSDEEIEKLLFLEKEIIRLFAFAEAASPIDIFKPCKSKIRTHADFDKYYTKSLSDHHDEKYSVIDETYGWFYFYTNEDKFFKYLLYRECDRPEFEYNLDHIYALKFSELPLDYVCRSFELHKERFWSNPLVDFFRVFDSYFYSKDIVDLNFDYDKIEDYYTKNFAVNRADVRTV